MESAWRSNAYQVKPENFIKEENGNNFLGIDMEFCCWDGYQNKLQSVPSIIYQT